MNIALPTHQAQILPLLDFEKHFSRTLDPIILSDIPFTQPGYEKILADSFYLRSSELNLSAKCRCLFYSGNQYEGLTCPKCGHQARSDMESLEHKVWLRFPVPVLHPIVYRCLIKWLVVPKSAGRMNYVDIILNPSHKVPDEIAEIVTGRGHQWFHDNFDQLIDYFINQRQETARKTNAAMRQFLARNRHLAFTYHVPALNSALHPIVQSAGRRQTDASSQYIMDAAASLSYLVHAPLRRSRETIDETVHTAYIKYIIYVDDVITRRLSKKEGLCRRHVFGGRMHLTARSVITPLVDITANYDELHFPWSLTVKLLEVHLIGQLMQEGMWFPDAINKVYSSILDYDPHIHQIINRFIAEADGPGLPVLFNRNPSMRWGSIQLLYLTKVKVRFHNGVADISDLTIAISSAVIAGPNAD